MTTTIGGTPEPTTNGHIPPTKAERDWQLSMERLRTRRFEAVTNARQQIWDKILKRTGGRGEDWDSLLEEECGYPGDAVDPQFYRTLYDKFSIANRAIKLMPMECMQNPPEVYENEDEHDITDFEEDWDNLPKGLVSGGVSFHRDGEGSVIHTYLKRLAILEGVGTFGVMLLGIDDGKNLQDPVDGVQVLALNSRIRDARGVVHNVQPILPDSPPHPNDIKGIEERFGKDSNWKDALATNNWRDAKELIIAPDSTEVMVSTNYGNLVVNRYTGAINPRSMSLVANRLVANGPQPTTTGRDSRGRTVDDIADGHGDAQGRYPPAPAAEGFSPRGDQFSLKGDNPNYPRNPTSIGQPPSAPNSRDNNGTVGTPGAGPFVQGTDQQYDRAAGMGMAYPAGAALSGTDQQYFGVQFGPSEEFAGQPPKQQRRLLFLRVFDESLVQVVRYEWNIRNPRFGLPVMYRITLNDPRQPHTGVGLPLATVYVHWSRVIHAADNLHASEIFGIPRLKPIMEHVLALRKIYAADGQAYWKNAFAGLSIETHPQLGADVDIDSMGGADVVKEQVDRFRNPFTNEALMLIGASAKTLPPAVTDPTPHVAIHMDGIAIHFGCPMRVFKGAERGEQASTQDDEAWNERKRGYQLEHVTPVIYVQFIDRLIAVGVLRPPKEQKEEVGQGGRSYGDMPQPKLQPPAAKGAGAGGSGGGGGGGLPLGSPTAGAGGASAPKPPSPKPSVGTKPPKPSSGVRPPVGNYRQLIRNDVGKVVGVKTEAGYTIKWPDLDALSDMEKAQLAQIQVATDAAYIAGAVDQLIPPADYLSKYRGYDEEEIRELLESAMAHQEETGANQEEEALTNPLVVGPGQTLHHPDDLQPGQPIKSEVAPQIAVGPGEKIHHADDLQPGKPLVGQKAPSPIGPTYQTGNPDQGGKGNGFGNGKAPAGKGSGQLQESPLQEGQNQGPQGGRAKAQIGGGARPSLNQLLNPGGLPNLDLLLNSNPEGCNQYTGPECSIPQRGVFSGKLTDSLSKSLAEKELQRHLDEGEEGNEENDPHFYISKVVHSYLSTPASKRYGNKWLFAVEGGAVVGAIHFKTGLNGAEITDLGAVKKGAGGKLLERAIDAAKSLKLSTISLESSSGARPYYEKLGFKPTGVERAGEDKPTHVLTLNTRWQFHTAPGNQLIPLDLILNEDTDGRWITVKGQHIHVPEGKDAGTAIKEHFANLKGGHSEGKGHEGHGHGHEIEHLGHQAHEAHEAHEIHEALGGGHEAAHEAAHGAHEAHEAASHDLDHGHGHTPEDALAIASSHTYGHASRAIQAVLNKVGCGGCKAAATAIGAIHNGLRSHAEKLVKGLAARYGHDTAAAILGAGAIAASTALAPLGVGGKAIPSKHLIGAIPFIALAETAKGLSKVVSKIPGGAKLGKATDIFSPGSKVDKAFGKVGGWVHAIKDAVASPFRSIGKQLAAGGLKGARAAGKLARRLGVSNNQLITNADITLSQEEIQVEAKKLTDAMGEELKRLLEEHKDALGGDGLDKLLAESGGEPTGNSNPEGHNQYTHGVMVRIKPDAKLKKEGVEKDHPLAGWVGKVHTLGLTKAEKTEDAAKKMIRVDFALPGQASSVKKVSLSHIEPHSGGYDYKPPELERKESFGKPIVGLGRTGKEPAGAVPTRVKFHSGEYEGHTGTVRSQIPFVAKGQDKGERTYHLDLDNAKGGFVGTKTATADHLMKHATTLTANTLVDNDWVTLESGQHVYLEAGDFHFDGPPEGSKGSGKVRETKPAKPTTAFQHPKGFDATPDENEDPNGVCEPNKAAPHESRPNLTLAEANAVRFYTSDVGFPAINRQVVTGEKSKFDIDEDVGHMEAAFAKCQPFKEPVVLTRGMNIVSDEKLAKFIGKCQKSLDKGGRVTLGRYTSTSTNPDAGNFEGNVTVKITAHKGLDLKPYSYHPSENEILLNHHGKYKISKVEQREGGYNVHMEQII